LIGGLVLSGGEDRLRTLLVGIAGALGGAFLGQALGFRAASGLNGMSMAMVGLGGLVLFALCRVTRRA
jgi:uncharacterized membrane protein YeaQ/YmgE (transglycosylase-associated protein family)